MPSAGVIKYTRTIRALLYHAALSLLAVACTQTRELRHPLGEAQLRELNEAVRGREVDIAYVPSNVVDYWHTDADDVRIDPQHVLYRLDGREKQIDTRSLHQLTWVPDGGRARGAIDGLVIGSGFVALGAGVGLFVNFNCKQTQSCTGEALAPALIGAAVGLVAAPLMGWLIGRHEEVTITSPR